MSEPAAESAASAADAHAAAEVAAPEQKANGKRPRELTDEERTTIFVRALVGKAEAPGILRKTSKKTPCTHQRKAVKFMLPEQQTRSILVHDPGLGKTYTVLLLIAAIHAIYRGSKRDLKYFISVPASCIEQWFRAVVEDLNIPTKLILHTNRLCQLTKENIARHAIIIVSRDTVGRAFSSCYEYVTAHHLNENNKWCSQWDRIPNTELHPIFQTRFSLFAIDELHFMRNKLTAWTKAHELVSSKALKSVGLSATPVFNSPKDLMGISTAMDLASGLKGPEQWFLDKEQTRVNVETIKLFNQKYVDRANDSILSLPPITHEEVSFDVCMDAEHVLDYNDVLQRARRLRFNIERNGGRAQRSEMNKLMAYLQTMQQFLVSPLLADKGATELKQRPELFEEAAKVDSGALKALRDTVLRLKERGFQRIMVAACHTSLLRIAEFYLKNTCPEAGETIMYDGSLIQSKRTKAIDSFLGGSNTVLLMSINAGGTGLHLVPGANAVVFWGSRPFSPMQVLQTSKRVHRIGQEHPVTVIHLIAKGSVDSAINTVHGDKLTLSNAVIDMELEGLEAEGGKWRTTGRIVDGCKFLDENGIFPEVDVTEAEVERAIRERYASLAPPADHADDHTDDFISSILNTNTGLPALPPSISQALMQNAANLASASGALNAPGLQL